jgi:hypothetical protein
LKIRTTDSRLTKDSNGSGEKDRARQDSSGKQVGQDQPGPLFSKDESARLQTDWDKVQRGFVDAPRDAVREADQLVAATVKRVAESFAAQRSTLEHQWERGGEVSTDDLRVALQRYRAFFRRLLAV